MIKRLRVTVDGKSYDITVEVPEESSPTQGPAQALLSAPAPAAPAAPTLPVQSSPTPAPTPKSVAPQGAGEVPSPLSGRVTAVVVQAGQEVKEGDHLVTLEAMKMNTFVFAPRGGKVISVNTEVGAVVEEGKSLVTIG